MSSKKKTILIQFFCEINMIVYKNYMHSHELIILLKQINLFYLYSKFIHWPNVII